MPIIERCRYLEYRLVIFHSELQISFEHSRVGQCIYKAAISYMIKVFINNPPSEMLDFNQPMIKCSVTKSMAYFVLMMIKSVSRFHLP